MIVMVAIMPHDSQSGYCSSCKEAWTGCCRGAVLLTADRQQADAYELPCSVTAAGLRHSSLCMHAHVLDSSSRLYSRHEKNRLSGSKASSKGSA